MFDRLSRASGTKEQYARARDLDRADDCLSVRAGTVDAAVPDDECVHGTGTLGDWIELVAEGDHLGLVRNRHVAAGEAQRDEPGEGVRQPSGVDGKRHVGEVEPSCGEGRVLHLRRERIADGITDEPHEPRPARDHGWGP